MISYKTVKGETESVTVIEKSKFICSLKGIEDETAAKEYVEKIRKKYYDATHNCYAYIADENALVRKFSDDGEPQGTAGLPMLNVLQASGLKKTVAVVARYFGGIKLGAGGLCRAYSGAVAGAIEKSATALYTEAEFFTVVTDYSQLKKLPTFSDGAEIIGQEFVGEVRIKIAVKAEENNLIKVKERLSGAFGGAVKIIPEGKGFFGFSV